ncbi:glycosyl hydrolase family 61-domain-containing protein [Cerioporus squamosus]|nr:glycosyl hydrolase family 61-domain-containing protein [Cerioporus squamosus]
MRTSFAALASLVLAASSVSARTVFSAVQVNGVELGHGVAVRVPFANTPITDITSNNLICNTGFIEPVSDVVASVPAGGVVAAEFHHTSAGYVGPDPSDPLDPTNKGPVLAYLAAVPDATQDDVTGLEWFKIFEQGLNPQTHQWASDILFLNDGYVNITIPSCVKAGQYLLRVESISLSSASRYPGAQFFMSCAQLEVTGGGDASPETVSFPGAYTSTDPGIVTNIYEDATYTPPGPAVFEC